MTEGLKPVTSALVDGMISGFLAGVILTIIGLHALSNFAASDKDIYKFPATIGNGTYTLKVDVETPLPIDPTTQHGIIFDAQKEAK